MSIIFTLLSLVGVFTCLNLDPYDLNSKLEFNNQSKTVVKNATVVVYASGNTRGTGLFVRYSNKVFVLTNAHVCLDSSLEDSNRRANSFFNVENLSLGTSFIGKATALDMGNDLCIITPFKPLHYNPDVFELAEETPIVGDSIIVSTYHPRQDNKYVLILGRIFQKDNKKDAWTNYHKDSYFVSTPVVPGMSGSPVVNTDGALVGVVWGSFSGTRGGYIVGRDAVEKFLKWSANR